MILCQVQAIVITKKVPESGTAILHLRLISFGMKSLIIFKAKETVSIAKLVIILEASKDSKKNLAKTSRYKMF